MPDDFKIPRATLKRLPLYYRLVSILKGKGIDRVNSKTISEALQIDSATIRRDFSYFGELGKKGYGYNIDSMLEFFKSELSESDQIKIAIIGIGNLGRALLIGENIGDVVVKHSDDIKTTLESEDIDVVILTTPDNVAQQVADELVKAGVKGILNFTPRRIKTPQDVQVHHIDFGIELQSLLFFMKNYSK